ncbi:MAG TPA: bifunctional chorismate mutase/prephenate dehydrogenase [Planctomycetota bacterium]|jgi:chorismate mutase/prephenate dehydrogenase|nr:bifunctional chorismate mutase/prephenate dehydrogenase [Planctomycetota bacterium]OQC19400.1 MAG: T-protein [Planctomycetes bacterium ADurb.Bin069]HNS00584.1 bifunctional chorismate mutase/prephenate dehydrogenase [Planctomycetota bacterium]HNU27210.1 bifunctional chorismate mutase/prephenate dehydrogenase [Planctomycetota bacterium]HOE31177.1 bifunctional chorismate mutase/prephenate dehydrogenase [Planctomycetota bacterium]
MQNQSPEESQVDRAVAQRLAVLRRKIDSVDGRLIDLLGERQAAVAEVVALKREHNLPVYHPAREENLISERRARAAAANVDPQFVEDIYRAVLRQSRIAQTAQIAKRAVRPGATVLLVGGRGAMGRYLERWFAGAGYNVRLLDREDWPEAGALCAGVDLALVGVPIAFTEQVVARLAPFLGPDCVLADITSVKQGPVQAMRAAHPGPVLGLHPLFGPATTSMDKQLVVVVQGRDLPACQWVIDQFAAWGCVIVPADPVAHDESMAVIQALRHFATFAFGQFLYRKRIDLHGTLEYSSPIYRLELGMVGRLFAQNAALYASIILSIPERRGLLKEFVRSLQDNLPMLEKGDEAAFCEEFAKIADWFGSFGDQALRESTYLIEKLIERF